MPLLDKVLIDIVDGNCQLNVSVEFTNEDGSKSTLKINDGRDVHVHSGDTVTVNFDGVDRRIRQTHPVDDIQTVDKTPEDRKEPQIRKLKI